jgi:hypothetical protein
MEWKKYVVENYLGQNEGDYAHLKHSIREKIYEELTSENESKILGASKILIDLNDLKFTTEQVNMIVKKCTNLPRSEGKSMRDYRQDVNAAIMLIKHFHSGAKCKCEVYNKWIQFIPEREVEMRYLEQLSEPVVNQEKYQIEYDLKCVVCNTKWQSNRNDGYHYPIWKWIKK